MAEAYLNNFGKEKFEAESAGLGAGTLNPVVVEVLKEDGIDISNNKTKSVFDKIKEGNWYKYVITVCDESSAERCPIFPGTMKRFHWSFPDPSQLKGSYEEKLEGTRKIEIQLRERFCLL